VGEGMGRRAGKAPGPGRNGRSIALQLRQRHAFLIHVLPLAVGVGYLRLLVSLEKQKLGDALSGVDLGREGGGVGDLQGQVPGPGGLQRGDVYDDPAPGVGTLSHANHQNVSGNPEVLLSPGQGEGVGRDDAFFGVHVHEGAIVEVLRVHHHAVDVSLYDAY